MNKYLYIFLLIFTINLLPQEYFNLKGLKRIAVKINDPQLLLNDVNEEKLRNSVEEQIKSAGIELSEEGAKLVIDVYEILDKDAASVWLNLKEKIKFERDNNSVESIIHAYSHLEFVPSGLWDYNQRIYQKVVGTLLPAFIKKYLDDNK